MKLSKGQILIFVKRLSDNEETILKANNCRIKGMITTDKSEYSTDFIMKWIELGFIKIKKYETRRLQKTNLD